MRHPHNRTINPTCYCNHGAVAAKSWCRRVHGTALARDNDGPEKESLIDRLPVPAGVYAPRNVNGTILGLAVESQNDIHASMRPRRLSSASPRRYARST